MVLGALVELATPHQWTLREKRRPYLGLHNVRRGESPAPSPVRAVTQAILPKQRMSHYKLQYLKAVQNLGTTIPIDEIVTQTFTCGPIAK
jgi:hypothetical protein